MSTISIDSAERLAWEALQVLEKIPAADLPSAVGRWEVEFGTDSTGDEAFWVTAVLDVERIPHGTLSALSRILRERLSASTVRPGAWTYVSLRTVSEDR